MAEAEVLRVRAYLTTEESVFVEDDAIEQALVMSEQIRRARGGTASDAARFSAAIVRAALRRGMMP